MELPYLVLQVLLFSLVSYWMIGAPLVMSQDIVCKAPPVTSRQPRWLGRPHAAGNLPAYPLPPMPGPIFLPLHNPTGFKSTAGAFFFFLLVFFLSLLIFTFFGQMCL